MSRVLVVEDEAAIAELIALNLRHAGYEVKLADTADAAQAAVDRVLPDLVLLDWMLPGQSGLALARRWRAEQRTRELPIIMLTARAAEGDKISGLDAGADDYLTKPFSPAELLARVRALLRRSNPLVAPPSTGCSPHSSSSTGCCRAAAATRSCASGAPRRARGGCRSSC